MSTYTPSAPSMSTRGPMGMPRNIGNQILLFIVTFGLYGVYWGTAATRTSPSTPGRGSAD